MDLPATGKLMKTEGGKLMTLQLTQKEQQLLQDQTTHEKVCIQKYQQYAEKAGDPQLKQLFRSFAQQEQQHLDTIN